MEEKLNNLHYKQERNKRLFMHAVIILLYAFLIFIIVILTLKIKQLHNINIYLLLVLLLIISIQAIINHISITLVNYYKKYHGHVFRHILGNSNSKYIQLNEKLLIKESNILNIAKHQKIYKWVDNNLKFDSKETFYKIIESIKSNKVDENNIYEVQIENEGIINYYNAFVFKISSLRMSAEFFIFMQDITDEIKNIININHLQKEEKNEEILVDKLKKALESYNFVHFFFDKSCTTINSFINITREQLNKVCDLETEIQETNQHEKEYLRSIKNTLEEIKGIFKSIGLSYEETLKSFKQLEDKTKSISVICEKLNQRILNLNNIVQLITSINDKTNILSINAGIESANAGEAGAGFKIIAQEIKKLSENTKKRVTEIQGEIKLFVDEIRLIVTADKDMNLSINDTSTRLNGFIGMLNNEMKKIEVVNTNINSLSTTFEDKIDKSSAFLEETIGLINKILKNNETFLYEIEEVKSQITTLKERSEILTPNGEKNIKQDVMLF